MEIVAQGTEAFLRWFEKKDQGKIRSANQAKVILIGNSEAGKTTFLNYYIKGKISWLPKSTHGIQIKNHFITFTDKDGNERTVTVKFWDFGGQEYYHGVYNFFLDKVITVFIFSKEDESILFEGQEVVDNRNFLQKIRLVPKQLVKKFPPKVWRQKMKKYNPDLIFLQKKYDKNSKEIPKEYLKLEQDETIKFYHTSMHKVAEGKLDSTNPMIKSWKSFKKEFEKQIKEKSEIWLEEEQVQIYEWIQEKKPCRKISRDQFLEKWKKILINTKSLEQDQELNQEQKKQFLYALDMMKKMGEVIYTFKSSQKKDTTTKNQLLDSINLNEAMGGIYIDPEFVTKVMYKILDYNQLVKFQKPKNKGKFTAKYIKKLENSWWLKNIDKIEESDIGNVLDFMINSEIVFINDKSQYVAPQYLEHKSESFNELKEKMENDVNILTEFELYFEYLPEDLMVNLICRYGGIAKCYYKDGVIFETDLDKNKIKVILEKINKSNETLKTENSAKNGNQEYKYNHILKISIQNTNEPLYKQILLKILEFLRNEKKTKFYIKEIGKKEAWSANKFIKNYFPEGQDDKNLNINMYGQLDVKTEVNNQKDWSDYLKDFGPWVPAILSSSLLVSTFTIAANFFNQHSFRIQVFSIVILLLSLIYIVYRKSNINRI